MSKGLIFWIVVVVMFLALIGGILMFINLTENLRESEQTDVCEEKLMDFCVSKSLNYQKISHNSAGQIIDVSCREPGKQTHCYIVRNCIVFEEYKC